jgi:hypothetical protein
MAVSPSESSQRHAVTCNLDSMLDHVISDQLPRVARRVNSGQCTRTKTWRELCRIRSRMN